MPSQSYRQRLNRFVYTDVDLDADSPQEATIGAMQEAIAGTIPDEEWIMPPCLPNTVRPVGQPRLLPYEPRPMGQEAFTSGPAGPQRTIDDLPDGAEVPEEMLDGLALHDGEIVEDVEASGAIADVGGAEMPDISEEMLEYLEAEEAVDEKRQQGAAITDEEYAALRETRQMLIQALTPVEDDGDIVAAPATDPTQPQLSG